MCKSGITYNNLDFFVYVLAMGFGTCNFQPIESFQSQHKYPYAIRSHNWTVKAQKNVKSINKKKKIVILKKIDNYLG